MAKRRAHPGKRRALSPPEPIDPDAHGQDRRMRRELTLHGATTRTPGWSANWIFDMEQMIRQGNGRGSRRRVP